MAAYTTLDYLPDLTRSKISTAINLVFTSYTSTYGAGWDNSAFYSTSRNYALLYDTFSFTAKEGATYDIFSRSYFDPFLIEVYDSYGNAIATDKDWLYGSYGTDYIWDFVAPYSGTYYVSAGWDQGNYDKYVSISIYEDVDTIVDADKIAPTVIITLSDTNLTTGETGRVTIAFSEIVTGFSLSDLSVASGTLSNLTTSDNKTWTATLTPTANTSSNQAAIFIAANSYTDLVGNANILASSSEFSVNTLIPVAPIKTFLTAGYTTSIADSAKVFGSSGSNDSLIIKNTALGSSVNSNVEQIQFEGAISDYQFAVQGTQLLVYKDANLLVNMGIQTDTDGTVITFSDVSTTAMLTGLNQAKLGQGSIPMVMSALSKSDVEGVNNSDSWHEAISLKPAAFDEPFASTNVSDYMNLDWVNDTGFNPYDSIGLIETSSGYGTGTLISPVHLLTNAHVVLDNGNLVDSVTFSLGQNGVFNAYSVGVDGVYVSAQNNIDDPLYDSSNVWPDNDLAVIRLDTPIGNNLGYLPLYSSAEDELNGESVFWAGYPQENISQDNPTTLSDDLYMWQAFGKIEDYSNYGNFNYNDQPIYGGDGFLVLNESLNGSPGSSGSPLMLQSDNGFYIAGVYSGGYGASQDDKIPVAANIDADSYAWIKAIVENDGYFLV